MESSRPEPSRRIPAMELDGAMLASSSPGRRGFRPATRRLSKRIGKEWGSISRPFKRQSRLSLDEKLWHSVRGLACTRGRDPCGFDCHGLLGIRRDAHEPDGSGTWKNS